MCMLAIDGILEENASLGLRTLTVMVLVQVVGHGLKQQVGVSNFLKVHGLMTKQGKSVLTRVDLCLIRPMTEVG
jgi:hypothetical protein